MEMLTASAELIFAAVLSENRGGKETSLYKQEFGKQPPIVLLMLLDVNAVSPFILHTIPFRAMAAPMLLPKQSCTSYWGEEQLRQLQGS